MAKKLKVAKENNTIETAAPDTPPPPQEAETAGLGFFCYMSGVLSTLSNVGINEFGKWAKVMIEGHPEVKIKIEPDLDGYND